MASELSRAQLLEELRGLRMIGVGSGGAVIVARIQAHDAALREHLGQLEHENKNLLTCQCEQCDGSLLEDAVCRKCFAALTAKVEQLENLLAVKRQLLVLEEEKVARLTARCEAAEQERDSALEAYNSVIDLSQSLKDSTIQSLQQQLAEREQQIKTLEAR